MLLRTLVKPSARSLTGQPAAPVPSIKRCERRRGQLSICAGILDSYRQQLGGNGTTTLLSVREEDSTTVVESLLGEEGIHFTEEDTPCSAECVIEVLNKQELDTIFQSALPDALVVIDWFKTDCPSCKYMAPPFLRMCRNASEHAQHIIFVKHNVYHDDHELTPLARHFQIKNVPYFSFHKNNGEMVGGFATRDKGRLVAAINQHAPVTVEHWEDLQDA